MICANIISIEGTLRWLSPIRDGNKPALDMVFVDDVRVCGGNCYSRPDGACLFKYTN